ncbi:S8 family peptidase [Nonomuraea typhae]|uniref:S8 family peptidase n=1 Tax=Nonomuraea typhae TaxID=2603600 RepID=UPI0012FCB834|nr:S8 family serine peptidase [Nonomuraea typhae]
MTGTTALGLIALPRLMDRTAGRRATKVGLIDGPVPADHPALADAHLDHLVPADSAPGDAASHHATSVAGILVARRGSGPPAICPSVTLVLRPIFPCASAQCAGTGTAAPGALASAIADLVDAGARVLNLSLALTPQSPHDHALQGALDYAARHGRIVVAAAGDHAAIGASVITRHRCVIPVVAYDLQGRPAPASNLGLTIGLRGVGAPGTGIVSLAADGGLRPFGGTSAAAALITGTIALLWSEFPDAAPAEVMRAVTRSTPTRTSVVPPLVNAWAAYETLHA